MKRRTYLSAMSLALGTTGAGLPWALSAPAFAATGFPGFLESFGDQARQRGISSTIIERAFAGLEPDPRVIEADQRQPEFVRPIWDYLDGAVSDRRLQRGQERLGTYAGLLGVLEQRFGIPGTILVAIWGLESDFGANFGSYNTIRSLATLGYSGRRVRFGQEQLMAALTILQSGDITLDRMVGSWAGAMGHTQFIPTTYLGFAQDFDGDGRRDIWASVADALASAANYLNRSGWRPGANWGTEVVLPAGFDLNQVDRSVRRPPQMWTEAGVRTVEGGPLPIYGGTEELVSLFLPGGYRGPAFALYPNFRVILRYNNASAYALAIGKLSDRLSGGRGIVGSWPRDEQPISRSDRERMQRLLTAKGYDTGGVDGIVGPRTRAALRAFQRDQGLPPDGFATVKLLGLLE